jgi:predicted aldo/keto reductase-like oxidoreductase
MRFPKGPGDRQKAEDLVMKAVERGINYFDTAYMYPGNEEALGAALAKNGVRDRVYIATKLPLVFCRSPEDFDRYFNKSLERLRTDHVDYYLMHMLTSREAWKKLCSWGIEDWIADKKSSGQMRQLGFSFHGIQHEFLELLEARDWDFCQIQYNYSDENFQAGTAGLVRAAARGLPVIVMEPLLGGKLTGSKAPGALPPEAVEIFKKADPALSPAAWALRWVWNREEVTCLLSGMTSPGQVEENAALAEGALPGIIGAEERKIYAGVLEIFNAFYKIHCTGCNYCMPCPRGVNIPACFASYNISFSIGWMAGMKQFVTSTTPMLETTGGPGRCVKCGKCESHCPQHLPVIKNLEQVRKRMEPLWYRWSMPVIRTLLGKNPAPAPPVRRKGRRKTKEQSNGLL